MSPRLKIHAKYIILALTISCGALYLNSFPSENYQPIQTQSFANQKHFQNPGSSQEIAELKTEFPNLWRPSQPGNYSVPFQDRVEALELWTRRLVESNYLKYAKPKKILVFDRIENYYGTGGRIKCPFLSPSQEKRLRSKCILKEDTIFTPLAQYDVYVNVRNWKPVIWEHVIPLQHVYLIQESPYVAKYADFSINNAILSSYSTQSDIVLPYGYFRKFGNSNTATPASGRNYAQGKTKLVAIVVSNCAAKNERLSYVAELQKTIPVDIYGACGSLTCDGDCFELVRKSYKFYLAFEKANCRDYITEKFWQNALMSDAIPIVMGAHPSDYSALAPPHSYIHVEDFPTPQALGQYLTLVSANDTLYNSYFAYRALGEVTSIWDQFFCRLCSLLHYGDIITPPPTWAEKSSWTTVNHCLPEKQWFWK